MSFAFAFNVDDDGVVGDAHATATVPESSHAQRTSVPFTPISRESLVRLC